MKKGEARVLKVKTFRNKMFKMFGKVRTVAIQDGRGLFLEDVCNAVGFLYDRTLHGFLEPDDVWYEAVRDDKGKDRIVALIDEPGLRMIVAEAHNMKAEVFGYWIRREVLTVVSWESDNPKESEERAKFRACVAKGMTATKKGRRIRGRNRNIGQSTDVQWMEAKQRGAFYQPDTFQCQRADAGECGYQ